MKVTIEIEIDKARSTIEDLPEVRSHGIFADYVKHKTVQMMEPLFIKKGAGYEIKIQVED